MAAQMSASVLKQQESTASIANLSKCLLMVDWRLRTVQMQFTTISVNPIVAQTTETHIYRKGGCAKLLLAHSLKC